MKHSAQINAEFVKEAREWDDLSRKEQREYLIRHPRSKRKLTAPRPKRTKEDEEKMKKKLRKRKSMLRNPVYKNLLMEHMR